MPAMIFSEDIVLRDAQFEGNKLASNNSPSGCSVALCRFGPNQNQSLVAIAQTFDKLLIYDLSLLLAATSAHPSSTTTKDDDQQQQDVEMKCISIKDQVISTLEVLIGTHNEMGSQDILLIGCTDSIMIYATRDETYLSSVDISAQLTAISSIELTSSSQDLIPAAAGGTLLACAGVQKLYTYQVRVHNNNQETIRPFGLSLEPSSERTISESITCLAHGNHDQLAVACLVTGSREHKIKVYPIDTFDQNIQTARLTLDETGPVSCLCPIETLKQNNEATTEQNKQQDEPSDSKTQESNERETSGLLPSLRNLETDKLAAPNARARSAPLRMNYVAYGLENGTIGVYHLLTVRNDEDVDESDGEITTTGEASGQPVMMGERLWRHKSNKQTPVSLVMFDCDGDGLDELIVGYRSGRLEVRSPFTGQMLAATRLFGGGRGQLVGLLTWSLPVRANDHRPMAGETSAAQNDANSERAERSRHALLACSSSSSLVAIRPRQKRPREHLRDYLSRTGRDLRALARSATKQKLSDEQILLEDSRELAAVAGLSEPLQLEIETRGDNARPVASESRQSAQLMQSIGALGREQSEMGAQVRKLHRELVLRRQRHMSSRSFGSRRAQEPEVLIHLSHSWDFDAQRQKLRLTLHVETSLRPHHAHLQTKSHPQATPPTVEMVELVDASSGRTLERDRHYQQQLLIGRGGSGSEPSPQESQASALGRTIELWLNPTDQSGARGCNELHRLRARVFCRPNSRIQQVYEQLVELGTYATFVPETLFGPTGRPAATGQSEDDKVTLTFELPDRQLRLQALDWLQANFLCFQYGRLRAPDEFARRDSRSTANHQSREHDVQDEGDHLFDMPGLKQNSGDLMDTTIAMATRATKGAVDGGDYLEFKFVDLRRRRGPTGGCHLRVCFSSGNKEGDKLAIESDDPDLLVDLVKSLVLDRLQLSMHDHLLAPQDHQPSGVEPLLRKLSSIEENSLQLEESENFIQTDIYDSAELIRILMPQLAIANQLNEFSTSRELLDEIAMTLGQTQSSAQSYQLNSRSRKELTREATCLREKISFLTGGGVSGSGRGSLATATGATAVAS